MRVDFTHIGFLGTCTRWANVYVSVNTQILRQLCVSDTNTVASDFMKHARECSKGDWFSLFRIEGLKYFDFSHLIPRDKYIIIVIKSYFLSRWTFLNVRRLCTYWVPWYMYKMSFKICFMCKFLLTQVSWQTLCVSDTKQSCICLHEICTWM